MADEDPKTPEAAAALHPPVGGGKASGLIKGDIQSDAPETEAETGSDPKPQDVAGQGEGQTDKENSEQKESEETITPKDAKKTEGKTADRQPEIPTVTSELDVLEGACRQEDEGAEESKEKQSEEEEQEDEDQEEEEEDIVKFAKCRRHKKEDKRLVCKKCDDQPLVCVKCLNKDHNGHEFEELEEEVVAKKAHLDDLVAGSTGLNSMKSDVEERRTNVVKKQDKAAELRDKDLESLNRARSQAVERLQTEFHQQQETLEKNFNARQDALMKEYQKEQKQIEAKWDVVTKEVAASVESFDRKLKEMESALETYGELAKPYDLLKLRAVTQQLSHAGDDLEPLKTASERQIRTPNGPVDFSKMASLTVEVVDKQKPAPPPAAVKVKETTPVQEQRTKGAASTSGTAAPLGTPSNRNIVQEPAALIVHDVPANMDETDLEIFFNSKKNGGEGDVEDIQFPVHGAPPRTAKIFFQTTKSITEICSKPRKFENGEKVKTEVEYCA